jgi:HTH-type transcriptional regulator/antitoxin HigA
MNVVIKATPELNYAALLKKYCPRVIETKRDYRRMCKQASELLLLGDEISEEEILIVKLLGTLIQAYEREHFNFGTEDVTPLRVLKHLMEANEHTARDLWDVIADKGTISKILSGQRSISKAQAKKLAAFYHVTPALFI